MKRIAYLFLAAIAAILSSGIARADGPVTFSAATDGTYRCISSCVGFTTSDPAVTVDAVNLTSTASGALQVTVSINGVAYSGTGDPAAGVALLAADGTYALATVNYWTKRTCTTSGRAQHCTTWRFATGGTLTL